MVQGSQRRNALEETRPERWLIERSRVSKSFWSPIIPDIFPVNRFQDKFKVITRDMYEIRKTKRLPVFKLPSLHIQRHLLHFCKDRKNFPEIVAAQFHNSKPREFPERSRTFNIDVTWPNWSGKYAFQNESFKIRTEWESAV
uniref:Uncharacterized protein n=1 Tax=Populus trichocarpa TaxID=3694 RepID=B9HI07_POPTR